MNRLLPLLSVVLSVAALAQDAAPLPGSFEVSFETQPYRGKYSPKHVLAAWVVDARGEHVRTLAVYGKKQARRLAGWQKAVGKPGADAVTGATRQQHQPLALLWDGNDQGGKPAPDGAYAIVLEYTETNNAGPLLEIKIEKGGVSGTRNLKDNEHFRNVTVRAIGTGPDATKAP